MRKVIANRWWRVEDGKKKNALAILVVAIDTKDTQRHGVS
jgi:hypothetical protein